MMVEWTETEVAAFLDGELKGVEHDRIARAIASDPAARALADRLRKVDELLREAYGAALDEPVPHAMRTAIRGHDDNPATADRDGDASASDSGEVVAFPARHKLRTSWWPMAAAASLALVVGYGAGELVHLDTDDGPAAALAVGPATTAIAEALEHEPSGASRGGVRPVASFLTTQGAYCREFETGEPPMRRRRSASPAGWARMAGTSSRRWRPQKPTRRGRPMACSRRHQVPQWTPWPRSWTRSGRVRRSDPTRSATSSTAAGSEQDLSANLAVGSVRGNRLEAR